MNDVEKRLARMEARLVQLMLYLKCDPAKRYGEPRPNKEQPCRNHASR